MKTERHDGCLGTQRKATDATSSTALDRGPHGQISLATGHRRGLLGTTAIGRTQHARGSEKFDPACHGTDSSKRATDDFEIATHVAAATLGLTGASTQRVAG